MVVTLFFVFLAIMVLGYIGLIFNLIGMAIFSESAAGVIFFLMWLLAIVAIPVGKLGAIITGVIWIVQTLAA